jgi:LacI family transcriptional regulator
LDYARHNAVPVVLIDRLMPLGLDQVGSENAQATAALVEHLASHGHERILFVSPRRGLITTEERLQGFNVAMSGLGPAGAARLLAGAEGDLLALEIAAALKAPDAPTAVVTGNNQLTIEFMKACRRLRVSIPDDLALVAFDDFEWADVFHPRLTAVAQATSAIGAQSIELMMSRLLDPEMPARTVRMDTTMVVRESCGCQ